jgi:FkbM family methyltransferase
MSKAQEATLERLVARIDKLQRSVDKLARVRTGAGVEMVRLDYPHAELHLEATVRHERKRAQACRKEPWTVEWLESLAAGGVLWDLGANVGAYSLIAAARPSGGLRVVSVEPSFSTYASLCRNIVLNDLASSITPLPVMVGESTGVGTLRYADLAPGASFHEGAAPSLIDTFRSVYEQSVLTFALDDLVRDFGLPEPDYIKLDIDGGETLALHGAKDTLRRVKSVMAEISNREREDVDPLMAEAGLRPQGGEHKREFDIGLPESGRYVRYERAG